MISSWWSKSFRLPVWILALGTLRVVLGGNITIDDADTSITYSIPGWNARSIGSVCSACTANPDYSLIHEQTFHDSTRGSSTDPELYFDYFFTGIAVYVYGIMADITNTSLLEVAEVDLVLTVDGHNTTSQRGPLNRNAYEYNQSFLSVEGLSNRPHTMRVSLQPNSLFLFDYLVYTTSDTTSSTSVTISQPVGPPSGTSSTLSGADIAGIVVGALGFIILVGALVAFLCYKQRRYQKNGAEALSMGPNFTSKRDNSTDGASPAAQIDEESNPLAARSYQMPASFNTPGATDNGVANSALNSKQRAMLGSHQHAGGGNGTSSGNVDDMSSHTGLGTSAGSGGRSPPAAVTRNVGGAPIWTNHLDSLYPHGVPVPMATPGAPDYVSDTGYMPTDTGNSSSRNETKSRSTANLPPPPYHHSSS